jgi:uncharacterized protein (TIGR00725 family)
VLRRPPGPPLGCRGVAQFGSALGSGPRGRPFKSDRPDHDRAGGSGFPARFSFVADVTIPVAAPARWGLIGGMERGQPMIAVCGGGEADSSTCRLAEAVGEALAATGAVVVCGGLGGVMEAACRGAKRGGGTTVGIVPGTDRRVANPSVDIAIATGMAQGRNVLICHTADGLIALAGSHGTLSEVALALNMDKPVVSLGGPHPDPAVRVADSPQQAVQMILHAVNRRDAGETRRSLP